MWKNFLAAVRRNADLSQKVIQKDKVIDTLVCSALEQPAGHATEEQEHQSDRNLCSAVSS